MTTRRLECACGCGRWFYWEPAFHRPPKYATEECRRRRRRARLTAAQRRVRKRERLEKAKALLEAEGYVVSIPGAP